MAFLDVLDPFGSFRIIWILLDILDPFGSFWIIWTYIRRSHPIRFFLKVTEANPDMPFPDVGRMLGEMWHNLTHEEKEEYRDGTVTPLTAFCT